MCNPLIPRPGIFFKNQGASGGLGGRALFAPAIRNEGVFLEARHFLYLGFLFLGLGAIRLVLVPGERAGAHRARESAARTVIVRGHASRKVIRHPCVETPPTTAQYIGNPHSR
jgi:hypothetical protein